MDHKTNSIKEIMRNYSLRLIFSYLLQTDRDRLMTNGPRVKIRSNFDQTSALQRIWYHVVKQTNVIWNANQFLRNRRMQEKFKTTNRAFMWIPNQRWNCKHIKRRLASSTGGRVGTGALLLWIAAQGSTNPWSTQPDLIFLLTWYQSIFWTS